MNIKVIGWKCLVKNECKDTSIPKSKSMNKSIAAISSVVSSGCYRFCCFLRLREEQWFWVWAHGSTPWIWYLQMLLGQAVVVVRRGCSLWWNEGDFHSIDVVSCERGDEDVVVDVRQVHGTLPPTPITPLGCSGGGGAEEPAPTSSPPPTHPHSYEVVRFSPSIKIFQQESKR